MEVQVDGYKVMIDDLDKTIMESRKWRVRKSNTGGPYVCYFTHNERIQLHREIMKPPYSMQIDHIDGNTLNNKRENLRICSYSENQWNRSRYSNNKSGYKGVSFNTRSGMWVAQIQKYGKKYSIGYHKTPELAYEAYKKKAMELHGAFAHF